MKVPHELEESEDKKNFCPRFPLFDLIRQEWQGETKPYLTDIWRRIIITTILRG